MTEDFESNPVGTAARLKEQEAKCADQQADIALNKEHFYALANTVDMREGEDVRNAVDKVMVKLTDQKEEISRIKIIEEVLTRNAITYKAEIENLNRICTLRGARMQVMREYMKSRTAGNIGSSTWSQWRMFLAHNGNAADWFNEHGIPQENSDE